MKEKLFSDSGVGKPRFGGQHEGPGYLPYLKIHDNSLFWKEYSRNLWVDFLVSGSFLDSCVLALILKEHLRVLYDSERQEQCSGLLPNMVVFPDLLYCP